MQISPARRAAFEILRRVAGEGAYSSVLLAHLDNDLNSRDRSLCHELVLGVLRQQLWLDRAIEHYAARKIESLDLPVVIALRLGLYQLRFLSRIPASAAINDSVNLVKAARVKSAASFANAILRRATREPHYDPTRGTADTIEQLAIETSHPRWLIERWNEQFGSTAAAAIARANNQAAGIAFRFTAKVFGGARKSASEMIDELKEAGAELSESTVAAGGWRVGGREDGRDAGAAQARMPALLRAMADEGLIYFQDEGSQLVAQLVGARDGERVLDLCAAPGSKSTLIAALAPHSELVSSDLYEHRVRTMKELTRHQRATNIAFVVHDATNPLPFPAHSFDRVLVDAPCSGTGTLRRNPEIRWRLQPEDFGELREKQQRMLDQASAVVKPHGTLVYSTCSLETDENETVAAHFLDHHLDFEFVALPTNTNLTTDRGAVRTWPHRDEVDGFFAIQFQRK